MGPKPPHRIICYELEAVPETGQIFDDINECYHAESRCLFDCGFIFAEFDWGVNVWDLVSDYNQRAAQFGGSCSLDALMGGGPTGFHVEDQGDNLRLWTVTVQGDCAGTLTYHTNPVDAPGEGFLNSLTNNSTGACADPRFSF